MQKKNFIFIGAVAATAALSLIVGAIISHQTSMAQTGAQWTPYRIEYKSSTMKPGGNPVPIADSVRAVRSDGAKAERTTYYGGDGSKDRAERILALPGGIRVRTDDTVGIMTATRNPAEDGIFSRAHQLDGSRSCAASLGGDSVSKSYVVSQGEPVLGYPTWLLSANPGLYKSQVWRAPDLGCAIIRTVTQKMDLSTGQVLGISEEVAVSVQPGDPDPSLFQLPSRLKNMAPSELLSAQAKFCCNQQLPPVDLAHAQTDDDHFARYRYDF